VSLKAAAAIAASLALAGCVTVRPPNEEALQSLPGWAAEDHRAALALVRTVCAENPTIGARSACRDALAAGLLAEAESRRFLERRFRAEPLPGEGVLTAYFTPLYDARRSPEGFFIAPVRPAPAVPAAAPERAAIEAAPTPDALAWMRPEDLFFLQTQGSGDLLFPDGARVRAAFAGSNGRPYASISRPMVARGLLAARQASADAEHAWLAAHRGPEADALMRLNARYVFFRLEPDAAGAPPTGSAGAPLLAGRSLAVDPAAHPAFELLWIDATHPALEGARLVYQRLAAAMDEGGAILGPGRADLYLGEGPAAGAEAGRVRHVLRLYRITPNDEARQ
jgi:membrane-bound lytic murein transglycosylase A